MILDSHKFYGRFIGNPISAKSLFCDLAPETEKKINALKSQKILPTGKIIGENNDLNKNIFILQEGKSELTFFNALTQKKYHREIENKEIIGFTQIISNSPTDLKVLTLTPCHFDVFPGEEFLQLLENEPQLSYRLLRLLSSDIQTNYKTFTSMLFG
ncbi:MAG: cyclic nucleotide-binding domain-containing protein [Pyrinomonadaceae bacterium]|nr:cyclic nucleotide-binding domain-containing protein [Pyrinomonadaceae bacterium]